MNNGLSFRGGGFTLVELQIALLIVALIAALISGALRLSSKTWVAVSAQQDMIEHRYLLAQYLRRHLSSARFMPVNTEKYGSVTGFFGDKEQLSFVATYPAFRQRGELYWWNLKLEADDDSDNDNLVASYFPYDSTGSGGSNGNAGEILAFDNDGGIYRDDIEASRIVIAKNVVGLEFEYFYRDEDGVQQWVEDWLPGRAYPLVIRINIALAERTGRTGKRGEISLLPEILINPRYASQNLYREAFDGGP
ncbi:MAG: hypothetical protein DRR06_07195 [Gammaproteobacteria bacterium]|nr:MAG: hypothetical protein DRR06_07195 [Gammaproteobacteria bacterium]RLA51456.1 MAG: hypothetical protein DRR42_10335 [Gammaproteobacteria bacterium]